MPFVLGMPMGVDLVDHIPFLLCPLSKLLRTELGRGFSSELG